MGAIVEEQSHRNQYVAAFSVNILTFVYGITAGWPSPNIFQLMSDESPLPSGKITLAEASWIASVNSIGGVFGNFVFGYATNRFGRKMPLILLAIPSIAGWLLCLFGQNVWYLYVSRLLNGIVGGGVFVIAPLFVSEISSDSVRGTLGTIVMLANNFGMLLAFILGNYFDYFVTPKLAIVLTVCFVLLVITIPETPSALIKRNKTKESEASIRYYRNYREKGSDHKIQLEVNKLKSAFAENDDCDRNNFNWSDLLKNPGKKGFIIGVGLAFLNQFCGCNALLSYSTMIFKDAGAALSPSTSAIIIAVIQSLGSIVSMNLVDRSGRKILYAISTLGCAIGLISLGVYILLKSWGYDVDVVNWIPIASLGFVIFIASLGILGLPYLVVSEIMTEKLKDFVASFCLTLIWFLAFVVIKCLPLMNELLGFHGSLFLFASVCLLSTVLIILYMPETKGKSYDEIMKALQ